MSRVTQPVYERIAMLATGGMGTVEIAVRRAERFQRLYALKRLHPHLREDATFIAMFQDEARVAGLVRHPNVVSVLDVGKDDDGPYLVMEYVDGLSVAETLAAAPEPLPLALCVSIAAQTARGLHAAHELTDADGQPLGLIHRDVSPRNILIGFDGVARATDFGIAKALGNLSRTSTGVVKGSLGYLPPEALRFQDLDRRSDLFALGVVLHELLTGQRLYAGDEQGALARRVLHDPPPDILAARPEAPPELQQLLFELLAKDAAHRPATAAAVAARLDAILHDLSVIDGAFDVAAYMTETFAEQKDRRARTIAAGLAQLRAKDRRGRRARRWAIAAAAAVIATGGAALTARLRDDGGLRGEYFDDVAMRKRRFVRVDRDIRFDWGTTSPDPRVGNGSYSVRWTGAISSPVAGERLICVVSDDGARVWFDGQLILDRWVEQFPTLSCAKVVFASGKRHALKVEYVQYTGLAYVRLFWSPQGKVSGYEPVPPQHLHRR